MTSLTSLGQPLKVTQIPTSGGVYSFTASSDDCTLWNVAIKEKKDDVSPEPGARSWRFGEGVWYGRSLCGSGRPVLLTPLSHRSESVVTTPGSRTSLMTTDLRGCFTYRTYGGRRGGTELFSRSVAQFIPRLDPESASLHSKGEGSDSQSNISHIYLVFKGGITAGSTHE